MKIKVIYQPHRNVKRLQVRGINRLARGKCSNQYMVFITVWAFNADARQNNIAHYFVLKYLEELC